MMNIKMCGAYAMAVSLAMVACDSSTAPSEWRAGPKLGAIAPPNNGLNVNAPGAASQYIFDVEPQPLTYSDAGTFADGAAAPLAWTPSVAGRFPKALMLSNGSSSYQTVCVDMIGVNGVAGAVDQCFPLPTNSWTALLVTRIYQQGDSGVVYVGY